MKSWSRIDWLILLLFAALVVLFYWRILTPNLADRQSFPPGDFHAQFWAFATFEVRELSAGRLPLWNPYTFAGAPFWADVQSAVFYPPSLFTILLSAPWGFSLFALEIEAIAHFWLAATFMYLFIRQITASRHAAVIAALIFTFSGYLTGYPGQQLAVLEADVWLPLILFFLYRANNGQWIMNNEQLIIDNTQKAPRYQLSIVNYQLFFAAVAWGLAVLAGHPQSALIIAYVSSAYLFFLILTTHQALSVTRRLLKAGINWFIFIITGLGLAAIQFIPAVEYTLHSVRAEGAYDRMSGGFPITDLIQVLLPGQVSLYSPLYVGVIGLIVALWVIFAAPNRHTIFWAAVAAVTLLISFGGNSFLYSPLYLFTPGFSIFRGQERWAFAVAFSLSVLVGYGSKQLTINNYQLPITNYQSPTHSLRSITTYLFLFSLLLTFLFFYGLNDTGWSPDSPFYGLLGASTLLTILLALIWLLWNFAPRLHPTLFTTLAAAVICFDLFSVNWQTNLYPQLPEWHTQTPPIVEVIKTDAAQSPNEPYRVYNEFRLYDNYGVPYQIEDLWGASPLRPNRYDKFLAPPMPIERAWELLNVKYVITWREELFAPSTIIYQEPANDGITYVHRLETVGPRAWLTPNAKIADDATILQTLADPNFNRWQTTLLEPTAEPFINQLQPPNSEPGTPNSELETQNLKLKALSPSHLTYHITIPAPALLVTGEPHYPGWQARVDGQPAPLLRADYILRAVPLPAGEHTVELIFRPFSFTIGAIISVISMIAVATIILIQRTNRGKQRA